MPTPSTTDHISRRAGRGVKAAMRVAANEPSMMPMMGQGMPGMMPMNVPIAPERKIVRQYWVTSPMRGMTESILELTIL